MAIIAAKNSHDIKLSYFNLKLRVKNVHRIITFFLQSSVFNLTNGITMMALLAYGCIVILELSKGSSFGRDRNSVNPLLSFPLVII